MDSQSLCALIYFCPLLVPLFFHVSFFVTYFETVNRQVELSTGLAVGEVVSEIAVLDHCRSLHLFTLSCTVLEAPRLLGTAFH